MIVTLEEVKEFLKLTRDTTDSVVEAVRLSGEAGVRRLTGRSFEQVQTAAARVFAPEDSTLVLPHDLWTTTDLLVKTDEDGDGVFETTWSSTDYELLPLNRMRDGEDWVYEEIRATGSRAFPVSSSRAGTVQVTAKWGWEVIPADVKWATCILGAADEKVRDLVAGSGGYTKWSQEHAEKLLVRFQLRAPGLGIA